MRLIKVVLLALAVLAVAAAPSLVEAADSKFEVYGGVAHNSITAKAKFSGADTLEYREHGRGLHVGGRYWFTSRLAAGVMVDMLGTRYTESWDIYEYEYEQSATGILAVADYKVAEQGNWRVFLQAGAGPYSGEMEVTGAPTLKTKSAVGYFVGGRLSADLVNSLTLDATANYRTFSADLKGYPGEVDVNSWGIGVGVTYRF